MPTSEFLSEGHVLAVCVQASVVVGSELLQSFPGGTCEELVTKELLGEFIVGFALALLLYNCAWALKNIAGSARRRGFLFAFIFSSFPVVAPLDVFVSDSRSQAMNSIYFMALLVMCIVSMIGCEIGLQLILRRAAFRNELRRMQ